jgi:hypothetical protein
MRAIFDGLNALTLVSWPIRLDRFLPQDWREACDLLSGRGCRDLPGAGLGRAKHHHQRRSRKHSRCFPWSNLPVCRGSPIDVVATEDSDELSRPRHLCGQFWGSICAFHHRFDVSSDIDGSSASDSTGLSCRYGGGLDLATQDLEADGIR